MTAKVAVQVSVSWAPERLTKFSPKIEVNQGVLFFYLLPLMKLQYPSVTWPNPFDKGTCSRTDSRFSQVCYRYRISGSPHVSFSFYQRQIIEKGHGVDYPTLILKSRLDVWI